MGIRTSERGRESLYRLSNGLTDRQMKWLSEWTLWNAGSLKLEVSEFLTIRVWTDKRRERAAYSTTSPLAFCGFIKRNDNHIFRPPLCLADAPLGTSLPLFVSASVENEGQVVSAGLRLSTSHSDQVHKQLQYPLSEITFFLWHFANENSKLVLSVEQQIVGFPLNSLLNLTLKIALMYSQFTQTVLGDSICYETWDLLKESVLVTVITS